MLGRHWASDAATLGRRWEDAGPQGEGGGRLVCYTAGVVASWLSPRGLLTCRQAAEVKNPLRCPLIYSDPSRFLPPPLGVCGCPKEVVVSCTHLEGEGEQRLQKLAQYYYHLAVIHLL